jgi:hypothetical protein
MISNQRGEYSITGLSKHAKSMFVAPPGHLFVARDFSGIEAVLVGWFAGSHKYTRLAKLGVHDYFNAHGILRPEGKITDADLPQLAWSDADLVSCFSALKARFKSERDVAKRVVHLSNYLGTPGKMQEVYPETFATKKEAALRQAAYFTVFPEIREWHKRITEQVDKTSVCRAPDGFVHRFYSVLNWQKVGNQWVSSFGDDAKRLVAFLPQHTAAAIGKLAMKYIWDTYPEQRQWLRLFIHDEIFGLCPTDRADECDAILAGAMGRPVQMLPVPPQWGMGSHLVIGSEGKRGPTWAEMK